MPRILYLQYTNPAAYPPLQHSSHILAEHGWEVLFLGIPARGARQLRLPPHPRIRYQEIADRGGGRSSAVSYLYYGVQTLIAARSFGAAWCYASDALSAPIAVGLKALLGTRILYHEHDALPPHARSVLRRARERVVAEAEIIVAPSAARLEMLPASSARKFVVLNCPRLSELAADRELRDNGPFRLVYQGSISRERLTPQFVDALAQLPDVELHIYGYETAGHRGYVEELLQRANATGLAQRVRFHGTVQRAELLMRLRDYDLGIATFDPATGDRNLQALVGASNKAFDYLAAGVPLLVSHQRQWDELFVQTGYAVPCDPADPSSIAAAVARLAADRGAAFRMGGAGRARVRAEWNYETQFAPVVAALQT